VDRLWSISSPLAGGARSRICFSGLRRGGGGLTRETETRDAELGRREGGRGGLAA
jgi:hypothetical protein